MGDRKNENLGFELLCELFGNLAVKSFDAKFFTAKFAEELAKIAEEF
jgi:hypothetical protein